MPEVFENRRKNNGGSDRSREEIYQLRIDYMEGLSRAEIKEKYGNSRKVGCDYYIDDRAVSADMYRLFEGVM